MRRAATMQAPLLLLLSASFIIGSALTATVPAAAASAEPSYQPQGFSARSSQVAANEEEEDEFERQAQTHLAYRQRVYDYSQEEDQEEAPRQVYQNRNVKQQSNYLKINAKKQSSEEEEESEEEIEEPDRLSQLLAKSSFNCNSKNSGYYADESLNCEVFHYCQDNQRHSWICPEGFTFHQIHLICMPPSNENICQQSSKYHIVNDYLYKPINLQEHQSKPNVTLRYSDRYYPENYYENERYDDDEEAPRQRVHHYQRQPVQVGFSAQSSQQLQQQEYQHQPQQHQQQQQHRHQPQQQQQQVHRHQPVQQTAVYRKPVAVTTIQPQLLQPQLQQHQQRLQTIAPLATPTPYRFYTTSPFQHAQQQQQQQQVYRTPEEINISLQQRRPQQVFLVTTTPRYYEDEYLYERRK